ncbi:MAG: ribonuclease P protein component [Sediminibacterium sp.]|nr:ribonuclease P protein component [Sediminibacterium sp.]MBP6144374.1 ribonuclease P protein component [Sediminibacterium sp.]
MSKIFTYQKKDKLKSRKQTQNLFSFGKSMTNAPLRLIYTLEKIETTDAANPMDLVLQAGVGAPTKQFKKAVQRNRVKRLLREAYRLAKPAFIAQLPLKDMRLNLFVLYMDTNVLPQSEINAKMVGLLNQLVKRIYGQA